MLSRERLLQKRWQMSSVIVVIVEFGIMNVIAGHLETGSFVTNVRKMVSLF